MRWAGPVTYWKPSNHWWWWLQYGHRDDDGGDGGDARWWMSISGSFSAVRNSTTAQCLLCSCITSLCWVRHLWQQNYVSSCNKVQKCLPEWVKFSSHCYMVTFLRKKEEVLLFSMLHGMSLKKQADRLQTADVACAVNFLTCQITVACRSITMQQPWDNQIYSQNVKYMYVCHSRF